MLVNFKTDLVRFEIGVPPSQDGNPLFFRIEGVSFHRSKFNVQEIKFGQFQDPA